MLAIEPILLRDLENRSKDVLGRVYESFYGVIAAFQGIAAAVLRDAASLPDELSSAIEGARPE